VLLCLNIILIIHRSHILHFNPSNIQQTNNRLQILISNLDLLSEIYMMLSLKCQCLTKVNKQIATVTQIPMLDKIR